MKKLISLLAAAALPCYADYNPNAVLSSVTLTSGALVLGGAGKNVTVDSAITSDGAGTLSGIVSLTASGTVTLSGTVNFTNTSTVAYNGTLSITTLSVTNPIGTSSGGLGANNSSATGIVQMSSGTASVSTALANGTTATTQAINDTSTKVATTAYVTPATSAVSALEIDWDAARTFTKTLTTGSTFTWGTSTHAPVDGETIVLVITNSGGAQAITWPTVKWSGGTKPTATAYVDVYTFIDVGGTIYGSAVTGMQ